MEKNSMVSASSTGCVAGPKLRLSKEKAAALQLSEGWAGNRYRLLTGGAASEMENWQTSVALASEQGRSTHRKKDSICESPWKVLLGALWRANPHFAECLLCFSCVSLVVTLWSLNTGIQQISGKCYKAALFRCFSPENRKY